MTTAEPGAEAPTADGGQETEKLKVTERSILQAKLTKLAIQIGYAGLTKIHKMLIHSIDPLFLGMTIAILTVFVLLLRFVIEEFAQK